MKQDMKCISFCHLAVLGLFSIAPPAQAMGQKLFADATYYAAGSAPYRVAVADFNHDGIQDLAVVDGGGGVSVLLGKESGGFKAPVFYAGGQTPQGIATADINGDKAIDILLA